MQHLCRCLGAQAHAGHSPHPTSYGWSHAIDDDLLLGFYRTQGNYLIYDIPEESLIAWQYSIRRTIRSRKWHHCRATTIVLLSRHLYIRNSKYRSMPVFLMLIWEFKTRKLMANVWYTQSRSTCSDLGWLAKLIVWAVALGWYCHLTYKHISCCWVYTWQLQNATRQ